MAETVQPTKNAADVYEVSLAIASSCIPGVGVFKAGIDILIRKRFEEGQRILLDEVASHGVDTLSNKKWDYFVPAAYRFFEQVRVGEYQHNLRVLAKMIAEGLSADDGQADVGAAARAARKLEMLPHGHLLALSRCERAFEIYAASSESDDYWIGIDASELKASFAEIGKDVMPIQCAEWLHELASRGVLTTGGRPSRVGGSFYYRNQFYREVMKAVSELNAEMGET